jgi:hypothetical protein
MTDSDGNDTDPLLRALPADQQTLLQIIGEGLTATKSWPFFQWVEAEMDKRDLDIEQVLASLPFEARGNLVYPLVRRNNRAEDAPVMLSVAGFAHLHDFQSTVTMFLTVVNALADQRASAPLEPDRVVTVTISGPQLVRELNLDNEPFAHLLPELLNGEPPTWHGAGNSDEHGWIHRPSSFLRRFRAVRDVDDYLIRLRAWQFPAPPTPDPEPVSPLSLPNAFDYLNIVWQLKFGQPLMVVPSAERAARLTLDAYTPEEFDSRLSALGEMIKSLDAPGTADGSLDRLTAFLNDHLPRAARSRVQRALSTLRKVTQVRNGGQHVEAADKAASALPALGLTFPVSDFQAAWRTVQARVVQALDSLRDEVGAADPPGPSTMLAGGAARSPAGSRHRPTRPHR